MGTQTELFRIVATVGQTYREDAGSIAARKILDWAEAGLEEPLPRQARDLEGFKHFTPSANCTCARILDGNRDVWAIRLDKTDSTARPFIRSTEAVIERQVGQRTTMTLRQLADRSPRHDLPTAETPAFVHEIGTDLGLYSLWEKIESDPWVIGSEEECERMIAMLIDSTRMWPAMVLTVPQESGNAFQPLLDPLPLARATTGLARVIVLPHQFTWELTNRFGKELSVYMGAVRVYLPGFRMRSDPWDHELVLPRRLETQQGRDAITRMLQRVAWQTSLGRFKLGRDLSEFATIYGEAQELEREAVTAQLSQADPSPPPVPAKEPSPEPPSPPEDVAKPAPAAPTGPDPRISPSPPPPPAPQSDRAGKSPQPDEGPTPPASSSRGEENSAPPAAPAKPESPLSGLVGHLMSVFRKLRGSAAEPEELQVARRKIATLEHDLRESEELCELFSDELAETEERAKLAESELSTAKSRIEKLEKTLARLKRQRESRLPSSWAEFSAWCERELSGKVLLSERAKRAVKKPKFKDVRQAANGLLWLAGEYRDHRLGGRGRDLRGPNPSGLSNEACGRSRFTISWGGRHRAVRWHLKNGNTHDPTRCLRIYYFWDDTSEQVIVASMPAHHRVTGR